MTNMAIRRRYCNANNASAKIPGGGGGGTIGNHINASLTRTRTATATATARLQNTTMTARRKFADLAKELPKKDHPNANPTIVKEAAKDTATANHTSKNRTFVEWYESHLQSRPVITKAVTGSILWGLGDIVAQVVPTLFFNDDNNDEKSSETTTTVAKKKEFEYDYPRTARAMFFGFGIHAPLSHVHYNFLEWMTVRAGFQGVSVSVFKTIMEQFVYWSWFSNSLYHGAMGAMQGMTMNEIYDRIADVLWDTQKAQWVFWIPVQLLNFQFVPVRHQLNVVLATSVVWTALLSAWYPPEVEGEGGGDVEAAGDGDAKEDKE